MEAQGYPTRPVQTNPGRELKYRLSVESIIDQIDGRIENECDLMEARAEVRMQFERDVEFTINEIWN